jgi:hypothetical protein
MFFLGGDDLKSFVHNGFVVIEKPELAELFAKIDKDGKLKLPTPFQTQKHVIIIIHHTHTLSYLLNCRQESSNERKGSA